MADYREVRHERLYLREPGTEKLRKTAEGRLKHLLAAGWRETERWHASDYLTVKVERSGHAPRMTRLPKPPPMAPRPPRGDFRGGQRGGGGFRGGPGGSGRGPRPGAGPGAAAGGPGGTGGGPGAAGSTPPAKP